MSYTAGDIARQLGGIVEGDASITLYGFAPADAARQGDLTFAESDIYFARAEKSDASAILVAADVRRLTSNNPQSEIDQSLLTSAATTSVSSCSKVLIRVPNARIAFAKVLPLFFPERTFEPGVHPSTIVHPTAQVDPSAHIGPFCVIGEGAEIDRGVVLEGANHIGSDAKIGDRTRLFPHVTIYARTVIGRRVRIHAGSVIGSDGFGYVLDKEQPPMDTNEHQLVSIGVHSWFHRKVAQAGNVIIHDDVEIGANVSIDRGTLGSTIIGKGTKIDNLVQIAHNVVIGEHSIIVAQVGIAGSTKLGNYVTLAGQAGLAGHLSIGNQVTVAAQSGVMKDIPDGEKWFGTPAQPDRQTKRQWLAMQKLPELIRRVNQLEKRLKPKK